jgi:uncharacterized protein YjbJ (UPF0337 family)
MLMNSIKIRENIKEFKAKLKSKFPQLTDLDLFSLEGNENIVMSMIEFKLGISKAQMCIIVDEI